MVYTKGSHTGLTADTPRVDRVPEPLDPEIQAEELKAQLAEAVLRVTILENSISSLAKADYESFSALDRALHELNQLRRSRGYWIGRTVSRHLRSPLGWLKLPFALGRALWERETLRRTYDQRRLKPCPPDTYTLSRSRGQVLSLKASPQVVIIPSLPETFSVWAQILALGRQASPVLQVSAPVAGVARANLVISGDPSPDSASNGVQAVHTLNAAKGEPFLLLRGGANGGDLELILQAVEESRFVVRLTVETGYSATIARDLIQSGCLEEAMQYARDCSASHQIGSVSLILANRCLDDDAAWLEHMNLYLDQFGISPIELIPGDEARFLRLSAQTQALVERGPKISVIMSAYNAEATLEFAANSILRQTWKPLELIIVDDASTDSTPAVLRELQRRDERVMSLRNVRNVGPFACRNLALGIATGDYIATHDSDDWAHPEALERQLSAMLASDRPILASQTQCLQLLSTGEVLPLRPGLVARNSDGFLSEAAQTFMIEARFLRARLGHWDTVRFGGDNELIFRARALLGEQFQQFRQMGILYFISESSLTGDPVHGVSRRHGLSPTRREYRSLYKAWHRGLTMDSARLPFPHEPRRFPAPATMHVSGEALVEVLNSMVSPGASQTVRR